MDAKARINPGGWTVAEVQLGAKALPCERVFDMLFNGDLNRPLLNPYTSLSVSELAANVAALRNGNESRISFREAQVLVETVARRSAHERLD